MHKSATRTVEILLVVITHLLIGLTVQHAVWANDAVLTNSLGMDFVQIPAGSFIMGSPQDEPGRGTSEVQHQVTISRSFYMQTTEVTVTQWQQIMGRRLLGANRGAGNLPMVKVSWHDAMKFIKRLNALGDGTYRLPTDAEWEYAARAGSTTAFSWGAEIDCARAMYGNNSRRHDPCVDYVQSRGLQADQPAPVKSYAPNSWGLYDMHGNVWEWCQDRFDPPQHRHELYKTRDLSDPISESGSNRIRRGGSWFGKGSYCRSANRTFSHANTRYQTTGFRLVREVQASGK
jgi:formylglycine-generating enzyme required for sulfatase activity